MSTGVLIWGAEAGVSALSLVLRRPWTELLSRRRYPDHVRAHPFFAEANRLITGGWTLYFAAAAVTTWALGSWASIPFLALTPVGGWLSYRIGDRYAPWKLRRDEPRGDHVMTTEPHPSQDELRTLIADKSDDEVLTAVAAAPGGLDGLLDQTVTGMTDAFEPDAAHDCVVGYEVQAADHTYPIRVEIRGRDVDITRTEPTDARAVLQLSVPDYLRLITGLLDGTDAYMSGRMKIRGDVMFAPQISRMFRTA